MVSPANLFKLTFILSIMGLAMSFAMFATLASGNSLDSSLVGTGTMDYRHTSEHSADIAMAENATVVYDYSRTWGADVPTEKATSQFMVASAKGGYKTQYVVKGSGAGHKIDYRATKISGDASFASEITLSATEAGGENFDSIIQFDTRDGNATIQGRVYNAAEGRPANLEELDAVGKYLLNMHLNVSLEPITPYDFLGFCEGLDKDVNMPEGIYILPMNDSKYNYTLTDEGKILRSRNSTN